MHDERAALWDSTDSQNPREIEVGVKVVTIFGWNKVRTITNEANIAVGMFKSPARRVRDKEKIWMAEIKNGLW